MTIILGGDFNYCTHILGVRTEMTANLYNHLSKLVFVQRVYLCKYDDVKPYKFGK